MKRRKKSLSLHIAGGTLAGVLSVALCVGLAMPAATESSAWNSALSTEGAYASEYKELVQNKVQEAKKLVTSLHRTHAHTHTGLCIPTSKYQARHATDSSKASYYYVCSCGKKLKATYKYGYTRTHDLATLRERYANSPKGGIAFTGSSLFSQWDSVAEDLAENYGYSASKVYNMAIGGIGADGWIRDEYVDAIAALQPEVVVVSGVNSLRYSGEYDMRSNWEAADETENLVELYIRKLKERLPNVKVLVVAGIKTLADYDSESYLFSTPISWQRIDLYNSILKDGLKRYDNVKYVDIQRYFMATFKSGKHEDELGYYCNGKKLMKLSSLKPAKKIVNAVYKKGVRLNPYFKWDLRHPTSLSYSKVWTPKVGRVAVKMARSS